MATTTFQSVGQRAKRVDAPAKLTGMERFTGDLHVPGMLYAHVVGSELAHGKITGIDTSAAEAMPGVIAVLTAKDLPVATKDGVPVAEVLPIDTTLYVGQPVALVLAESRQAAEDAAEFVSVELDELPVVIDPHASSQPDAPLVSEERQGAFEDEATMHNADAASATQEAEDLPPNVTNSSKFERGDVEAGFAASTHVVELDLTSKSVHQGYIETQVCLAIPTGVGGLTVHTSTQAAFHVRQKVADTLGYGLEDVTTVPMPVGGGFGGKFGFLEPLVASAAVAVNRPVLLQYGRTNDLLAANPAPEARITIKLGADDEGVIQAVQANLLFDAGSASGSPMGIAAILLGGYYKFPNLAIEGIETKTHRPSGGSYRAPGAQQATFAIESAVDELCRQAGFDPLEFRLKNCVEQGDLRPNGAEWPKIALRNVLETMREHPLWQQRDEIRAKGHGIGVAIGGWPGAVEPATAVCRLDADGKLTVSLGSVDLSGTNTTFAQIAAEGIGGSLDDIRIKTADTSAAPYAGGTGGSKITFSVGPAVANAVDDAVRQIKQIASEQLEAAVDDLEVADGKVRVKGVPDSAISLTDIAKLGVTTGSGFEPVYGRGGSAAPQSSPGFAGHIAEVDVDELTGVTRVVNYAAVQDVGFAINPASVEGQIHGGVAQGIGWALYEALTYDEDGQPTAATLMDYTLPRAYMIPPIDVRLVQVAAEDGPYGAKGVGEPPAIPGAATIANAIRDVTGKRMTNLPILPKDVLAAR